jgi:hypothetical protein
MQTMAGTRTSLIARDWSANPGSNGTSTCPAPPQPPQKLPLYPVPPRAPSPYPGPLQPVPAVRPCRGSLGEPANVVLNIRNRSPPFALDKPCNGLSRIGCPQQPGGGPRGHQQYATGQAQPFRPGWPDFLLCKKIKTGPIIRWTLLEQIPVECRTGFGDCSLFAFPIRADRDDVVLFGANTLHESH